MNLVRLYLVIQFWVVCFLSFIALFCPYWNSNMLPVLFYIPQVWSLIAGYAQQLLTLSSVPFLRNRKFGVSVGFNAPFTVLQLFDWNYHLALQYQDLYESIPWGPRRVGFSRFRLNKIFTIYSYKRVNVVGLQLVDESLDEFSVILYNFTFCTFLFPKSSSSGDLGYTILFRFKSTAYDIGNSDMKWLAHWQ